MCVKTSSVTSVRKSTNKHCPNQRSTSTQESDIIITIILIIIIAIRANCNAQRGFARESKDYLYIIHQQILYMLIS